MCARRLVENNVVEYMERPDMRDDASIVPYKFVWVCRKFCGVQRGKVTAG